MLKFHLHWPPCLRLISVCHSSLFMSVATESPGCLGQSIFTKILILLTSWMVPLPSCSSGNWPLPKGPPCRASLQPSHVMVAFYSIVLIQVDLKTGMDILFVPHCCFQIILFLSSLKLWIPYQIAHCSSLLLLLTNSWDTPNPLFSIILVSGSPSLSLTLWHYW